MAIIKYIFFVLIIIKLCSGQCAFTKVKWCINSDYMSKDGGIVDKESCKSRPCVISTCRSGYMNYKRQCIKMDSKPVDFEESLTLYKLNSGEPVKSNKKFFDTFQVVNYKDESIYFKNNCTDIFATLGSEMNGYFLEDGSFFLLDINLILKPEQYILRFAFDGEKPLLKLKIARDAEDDVSGDQRIEQVLEFLMFVSVFFMILVIIVYALCRELRTTPGLTFMTYVTTLCITFLLLTLLKILQRYQGMPPLVCYIISPIIHFFIFSSNMWMNIMGFDIWWTLRDMYYKRGRDGVNYRKYTWYCIVAWIPPLLYVITEICVDEFTNYGPMFYQCTACSNKWYKIGPNLTMQTINFIPLVLIIYNLIRYKKTYGKHLNTADSNSTGPQQNAILCIKISIMLGTNWFLDVIVAFFEDDLHGWFKYMVETYNSLFGLILFLAYILKAEVLLKLFRRFSINNKITEDLERRVSRKYSNTRKPTYSAK